MTEAAQPAALARPVAASGRRQLLATVGLIVLGAGGIVLAASRSWVTARIERSQPFAPITSNYTGRSLHPAMNGLAIVALLVGALVLISGRWPRRLLGALLAALALATGWYGLRSVVRPDTGADQLVNGNHSTLVTAVGLRHHPGWALLTVGCSALLLVAGVILLSVGGRWPVGWSQRYSAPVEAAKSGDPWRRLDRGEDPTIFDG